MSASNEPIVQRNDASARTQNDAEQHENNRSWDMEPHTATEFPPTSRTTGFIATRSKVARRCTQDNQIDELKDLFMARIEELEKQNNELKNRITALEMTPAYRNSHRVEITPWRVLNTLLVLALGAYKAAATYQGQTIGATTVDWIGGVVWVSVAYWGSFYETLLAHGHPNSKRLFTWLFTRDLSGLRPTSTPIFVISLVAGLAVYAQISALIFDTLEPHLRLDPSTKNFGLKFMLYWLIFNGVLVVALLFGALLCWFLLPKIARSLRKMRIPSGFQRLLDTSDWLWHPYQEGVGAHMSVAYHVFYASAVVLFALRIRPYSLLMDCPLLVAPVCWSTGPWGFAHIQASVYKMGHRLWTVR